MSTHYCLWRLFSRSFYIIINFVRFLKDFSCIFFSSKGERRQHNLVDLIKSFQSVDLTRKFFFHFSNDFWSPFCPFTNDNYRGHYSNNLKYLSREKKLNHFFSVKLNYYTADNFNNPTCDPCWLDPVVACSLASSSWPSLSIKEKKTIIRSG